MDWNSVGAQLIVAVTPVVSMLLIWVLKAAWSKIPASIVLFAAPVVGIVVNFGLNWLDSNLANFSVPVAAALGLLATTLREWISTLNSKGTTGPVSVTKLNF